MKKMLVCLLLSVMLMTSCLTAFGETYPAEIDMNEAPYEVAIQIVNLPGTNISNEAALEEAINAITLPAINCTVDLQFIWINEITNTTSMAIAGDEKIDLVHVATVQTIDSMAGSDMLIDMNEGDLLQNRGPALVSLFADTLPAGQVRGQQLAIPANVFNAAAKGINYNKDFMDAHGITVPETGDLDTLEELLYAVKATGEDVMPWYVGGGELNLLYWLMGYEGFGSEGSYGVVLDASRSTTVENLYATDLFKDYCLRMYKWRQDGLIGKDMTDDTTGQTYMAAQQVVVTMCKINPYLMQQDGMNYNFTVGYCANVPATIAGSDVKEYMWGIAANSERPDKAMDFLNLIYSNADVANLLKYGLPGENYEFVEGSDRIIQSNGSYVNVFYVGGDDRMMYIQVPADESYVEQREAFEASATVSPLIGYTFDDSQFQAEASVIYTTIMQYLPILQNGMCKSEEDTIAYVEEFNAALSAAGIYDVIAANQAQMDEFLAGNQ